MKTFGRSTLADVQRRAAVSRCCRQQREQGVQEIEGSIAIPESGRHPRHENDGFVRIGVDMILHLDVLKATLAKEDASGEAFSSSTSKQMSLDLEDLW
jgi:hypothetical protein